MKTWRTGVVFHGILVALTAAPLARAERPDPAAADAAANLIQAAGVRAGLFVHLGARDGARAPGMVKAGRFVMHGLALDAAALEKVRGFLQAEKIYGQASAALLRGPRLPYADNMVNLLLADDLPALARAGVTVREIMRVVCPGGVAMLGGLGEAELKAALGAAGVDKMDRLPDGRLTRVVKPRPAEMGEWPQRGCDAGRTYVSPDTALGLVTGLRWLAGPYWPLGRDYQRGAAGMVSAGGRNFYINWSVADNFGLTPMAWETNHHVFARDAFNGLLLWTRPINMKFRPFEDTRNKITRHRPDELEIAENLAVLGERVYTVIDNAVVALDAATGRTLATFEAGYEPGKLLIESGLLVLADAKGVRAYDPATAKRLWDRPAKLINCVGGDGRLFCLSATCDRITCLETATGKTVWEAETKGWFTGDYRGPMYYKAGVLAFPYQRYKTALHVASAKDGKHLWSNDKPGAYGLPVGGLIWYQQGGNGSKGIELRGHDPLTGVVKTSFAVDSRGLGGGCCPNVATERVLVGTRPMKTLDLKTRSLTTFHARHPCRTGLMPANGLLYAMPQGCARCAAGSIRGYQAVASDDPAVEKSIEIKDAARLQKGPAYGSNPQSAIPNPQSDWPTYRHDNQRSCLTKEALPTDLAVLWEEQVDDQARPFDMLDREWIAHRLGGDRVTGATVAEGKVFVAVPESHRVVALDAATGKRLWAFTADGRLDTPPTIHRGLCLFGSTDGWAYCLRAADGALVWRFNAAARDKAILAFGQLESVSPVVGGVLVEKDVACFLSGRARGAEGGVNLYAVSASDGNVLAAYRDISKAGEPDLLVSDGQKVQASTSPDVAHWVAPKPDAKAQAGLAHLYVIRPLLNRLWRVHGGRQREFDRKWMHKYFFWGHVGQVTIGDPQAERTWAYKWTWTSYGIKFARELSEYGGDIFFWRGAGDVKTGVYGTSEDKAKPVWSAAVPYPAQVESLLVAGDVVWSAGPVDKLHREKGALLTARNAETGAVLKELTLKSTPAADGLAVARGRMFVSTQDGKVICLGGK